jgi:hypothetical protein
MFQDSGMYPGFFPDVDGPIANRELLRQVHDFDVNGVVKEDGEIGDWLTG